ncbi:MAG: YSC84-related protein [Aquincola sp.]|nr:YSC84-related protein [Aquincola sp.]
MITKRLFSILVVCTLAAGAGPAWADAYQDTIAIFKKAEESGKFFSNAYGYAVFPTIGKGGIGIGGAYGKGRVYEKGRYIGDTSMTQLSVGFQLGGQGFSQIIFFENAGALKTFTEGEFEFGAEASAVAITLGVGAKAGSAGAAAGASVDKDKAKVVGVYNNGMATFTVVKGGLMYEAAIAGQKFRFSKR